MDNEIEDLESLTSPQAPIRMGTYICTVCKDDYQSERKRGTPVRICPKCQEKLNTANLHFCTTCRISKPMSDMMAKNLHRCRKCHYESIGMKDQQPCAQCKTVTYMVKYSKVCKACFDMNDKNQTKYCVRCEKPVSIDEFPETGNVCLKCKAKHVSMRISPQLFKEIKFLIASNKKANDINLENAEEMIGFLIKEYVK